MNHPSSSAALRFLKTKFRYLYYKTHIATSPYQSLLLLVVNTRMNCSQKLISEIVTQISMKENSCLMIPKTKSSMV